MIRGFGPARPRMIAAVHTNAIADTVAFAAGGTPVRLCSDEAQLDECFEASRAPLIVTELGRQLSPVMLSRIMSAARSPIIAVLPTGQLPTSQILSLALSGARFELVHDLSELSAAIRLAGTFPLNSEIGDVARTIAWRMDRESLEDVMGLMILGRRRTTIREALARLDRTAALRTSMRERVPCPHPPGSSAGVLRSTSSGRWSATPGISRTCRGSSGSARAGIVRTRSRRRRARRPLTSCAAQASTVCSTNSRAGWAPGTTFRP